MSLLYQSRDAHLVDYQLYQLPGCRGRFRGPPPASDSYVACVGAAQTFGRFVQTPFPRLLAASLGIDTLNLGRGGAGPTFPLHDPGIMEYINRARVVIVQFFSGRSQSNSLFQTVNHGMYGINLANGTQVSADQFYTWLMSQDPDLARRIIAETRDNYVADMTRLLAAIEPPKILLWFSTRTPEYSETWELPIWRLWGRFPQFVNQAMAAQLRGHADVYLECTTSRGSPQPIVDSSGRPASNSYYPAPEMHEDAANVLLPACREILAGGSWNPRT
jgi:hypothetical protein